LQELRADAEPPDLDDFGLIAGGKQRLVGGTAGMLVEGLAVGPPADVELHRGSLSAVATTPTEIGKSTKAKTRCAGERSLKPLTMRTS
jgi:hypothetical protein